jgi:two-component system, chemotaxis family, chemotaxis protein CheY
MKTLIVEDDFTSRLVLQGLLGRYGECHVAVNGKEAVEACADALITGKPYQLVCLDIMMPEMDGLAALKQIRADEERVGILSTSGAKIVMTTALGDLKNIMKAYDGLCDAYLTKPIDGERLHQTLDKLSLRGQPEPVKPRAISLKASP